MDNPSRDLITLQIQAEKMLSDALRFTEIAMDLKCKSRAGAKLICNLHSYSVRSNCQVTAMSNTSEEFFVFAQKLCLSAISKIDSILENDPSYVNIKQQYEKLLAILESVITRPVEDLGCKEVFVRNATNTLNETSITEKIQELEARQIALSETDFSRLISTPSLRSCRFDTDEKYPESLSHDSLLEPSTVSNLPTLSEDIFMSSSSNPVRSISLCSLKSLRKLKMSLQRARSSLDDSVTECEESDLLIHVRLLKIYTTNCLISTLLLEQ